jgi:hypothetical protein
VIQTDHFDYANYAGCIALIDGDTSENGCAAKYQAYAYCLESVCFPCARSVADHRACFDEATFADCSAYRADDVCARDPKYAICNSYASYAETTVALGKLFCVTGPTTKPVEPRDAGSLSDAATAPDADDAD